jgi:hypothetical protein
MPDFHFLNQSIRSISLQAMVQAREGLDRRRWVNVRFIRLAAPA